MQKENLAAVKIKVGLVAVIVIAFIAGAIEVGCKLMEELIVFVQCKMSKLKVSGVAVVVAKVDKI